MLLNQLVQEHQPGQAGVAAVNDNAEPASGVVLKAEGGVDGKLTNETKQSQQVEVSQSRAEQRNQAMQRFLSAQTDVSDEVLQLYKLVCTGFR